MKAFKLLGIRIIIGVKSEGSFQTERQDNFVRHQALGELTDESSRFFQAIRPEDCDCMLPHGQDRYSECYNMPLARALDLAFEARHR